MPSLLFRGRRTAYSLLILAQQTGKRSVTIRQLVTILITWTFPSDTLSMVELPKARRIALLTHHDEKASAALLLSQKPESFHSILNTPSWSLYEAKGALTLLVADQVPLASGTVLALAHWLVFSPL